MRFDWIFRDTPNAYMVVDRDLRYLAVNPAYEAATGRSHDELIGRRVFDVFPGADNPDGSPQADAVRVAIERAFATGQVQLLPLVPYEMPMPDGRRVTTYWSASHTPLRDETGAVVAVLQHTGAVDEASGPRPADAPHATWDGVAARSEALTRRNAALSDRLTWLEDLFLQAPGFMAVLRGAEYRFEMTNAAYEALAGRTGLVGLTLREALPELAGQGYFELLDRVRATGEAFIGRGMPVTLATDAGERVAYVDFVYQPIVDGDGRTEAIFVQGAEVTDREQALQALRESEGRFRTIANLVPQLIWSTRPDGWHDFYNQRWYDFSGVPAGSTDGEAWNGMFHPDDQARAWARWRHSLATGEPYEIEYRLRHRSGEYRWVLGRALPVRDADGQIIRWMGTCTEIDELKRVQAELEQARVALDEANRQKDRFLAMLAHELRNPLAPVATAAQLLKMAPDKVDVVKRASDIIDRQAKHMRALVEDLMDVSRVTRGLAALERRTVALAPVLAAAVEQTVGLTQGKGQHLDIVDDAPGLELHIDPMRVTQILANLLGNAAKYTPDGGHIVLHALREGETAVVRVHDDGIGMAPETVGSAFELFHQASATPQRQEGLGIGLAVARGLARLHGGDITAASEGPGRGATFELRLPTTGPASN